MYQNCEFDLFGGKKCDRDGRAVSKRGIMAVRSAATKQKGIRAVKDRSPIAGRSELKEFLRHDRVDAISLHFFLR